jgi:hypothetical protein
LFKDLGDRRVEAEFTADRISTDAGGLLIREVADEMNLFEQVAACFSDYRDPARREHEVDELIGQRVMGLVQGYEDLSDHDDLRGDPLWATLAGKTEDPAGADRRQAADRGQPLASKATLGRLEHAPETEEETGRYCRISADHGRIEDLLVELFLQERTEPNEPIILDLDATHNPLHGRQEGRHFLAPYDCYCYLPLYIFCGEELVAAKLRSASSGAAAGALEEVKRVVGMIREEWPGAPIILRADSGFSNDPIMDWCEEHDVDYVFGLAKNARLERRIADLMEKVSEEAEETGQPVRRFTDFQYETLESWTRKRRVVAKAEHLGNEANPRFVVSSLTEADGDYESKSLYEKTYCARGEMENRIKEQLGLFADRTSAHRMRVNQMRLWLSSLAYVLLARFRAWGLKGTEWARAQIWKLRAKLLKIGALVRVSVRRVYLQMSRHYPYQTLYRAIKANLREAVAAA